MPRILQGNYQGISFIGRDLSGYTLMGDFTGADFTDTILTRANLRGGIFQDANFTRANLRGARVSNSFYDESDYFEDTTMPDGSIHP